jgi:hypothetical protein
MIVHDGYGRMRFSFAFPFYSVVVYSVVGFRLFSCDYSIVIAAYAHAIESARRLRYYRIGCDPSRSDATTFGITSKMRESQAKLLAKPEFSQIDARVCLRRTEVYLWFSCAKARLVIADAIARHFTGTGHESLLLSTIRSTHANRANAFSSPSNTGGSPIIPSLAPACQPPQALAIRASAPLLQKLQQRTPILLRFLQLCTFLQQNHPYLLQFLQQIGIQQNKSCVALYVCEYRKKTGVENCGFRK